MDECSHFMAFAATTNKVIMESSSDSEDSSDDGNTQEVDPSRSL